MRIITLNANGIRSAARKNFFTWLARQRADVVCIQETKAQTEQLQDACFYPNRYHCQYVDAEKKGYSGVALYSKIQPQEWRFGFGNREFDAEGRFLEADYGQFSVISLYAPSGSSGEIRQQAKFRFMKAFMRYLKKIRYQKRHYIICGDWNIAHKEIDLKNWRSNQKNSGFLPEERRWLSQLFDKEGFNDAFREVCPLSDQYTWWSNRGQSWDKNVGWRIDYQITSPGLRGTPHKVRIYKKQRFSDHAPLIIDYDIDFTEPHS